MIRNRIVGTGSMQPSTCRVLSSSTAQGDDQLDPPGKTRTYRTPAAPTFIDSYTGKVPHVEEDLMEQSLQVQRKLNIHYPLLNKECNQVKIVKFHSFPIL